VAKLEEKMLVKIDMLDKLDIAGWSWIGWILDARYWISQHNTINFPLGGLRGPTFAPCFQLDYFYNLHLQFYAKLYRAF
jgi:hypothetical protein